MLPLVLIEVIENQALFHDNYQWLLLMSFLDTYFILNPDPRLILAGVFDPGLVLLSIVVAIFASSTALHLIDLAKSIPSQTLKQATIVVASMALGLGIWSMHFIGMLAFSLCTSVSYDPTITLLSALPGILACWCALELLSKQVLSRLQLIIGGILVGAGIGTMHYTGMAAMEMTLELRYDPYWFAISIVVAVLLAILSLYSRYGLNRWFPRISDFSSLVISGSIMGIAISGMHYTGMAAARVIINETFDPSQDFQTDYTFVAISVAFIAISLTVLVAAVTGLLRYRALLQEKSGSEARLAAILSTAVDGIISVDAHRNIQEFNESAENIFGWQSKDVIGHSIDMLVPEEDREKHQLIFKKYLNENQSQLLGKELEVNALHKSGRVFPMRLGFGEVIMNDQSSLYVGFISDITERRAIEKALQEREAQYSSLIQNMPGVVFRCLVDKNWTIVFVSEAIKELTGWRSEQFFSGEISIGKLILEEDRQKARDTIANAIKARQAYSLEYRIKHKQGHIVSLLTKGGLTFNDKGEPQWVDGIILDISERRAMEEALRHEKIKAEVAAEAKASFMANMSHEIRTPMNAILGFSDILKDTPLSAEQSKYLRTISDSARSLLHLLNDILDTAKLEKGRLELEQRNFSLHVLLDSVISTLGLEARNKGVSLVLDISPNVEEFYLGAVDRIRQVLMNLIGNALKFTEEGSVSLSVKTGKAGVAGKPYQLIFLVTDTGIGVDADRLKSIFNPFTQADASMSRRFGGTGLGTTISKQLVELMGGSISATSQLGEGSCFRFTVPLEKGSKEIEDSPTQELTLPPMSILVADDIEQNVRLLQVLLSRDGHSVSIARDGIEALSLCQSKSFDLVLMDVQMPNMDGLTAAQEIRKYEHKKGKQPTPIIALTASVLREDRNAALGSGMNGFSTKPVDMLQLKQEIARVLGIEASLADNIGALPKSKADLIDVERGLSLWGDMETFTAELKQFCQQHHNAAQRLEALMVSESYTALKEQVHALRGVAGNLALVALLPILSDIEALSINEDKAKCIVLINNLSITLAQLVSEINGYKNITLDERPIDTKLIEEDQHSEQFIQLLNKMINMADRAELDESVFSEFIQFSPNVFQREAKVIVNLMEEFDFTAAENRLAYLKISFLEESK